MAENKTKPTSVSPRAFVQAVPNEQRRKDGLELLTLMEQITGHKPKMWGASIVGFDRYHYKYDSGREGDAPLVGFSPRKQELVIYLGTGVDFTRLLSRLGKHRTGVSCLYVKKLDDVDRGVLRTLIEQSVAATRRRYPASRKP